jgi:hypothetical protein
MNTPTWKHLFYFVAASRSDKTAPDLNKAVGGRVFLTYEDADRYRNDVSKKIGYKYEVFVAEAVIPRIEPVTEEVGTKIGSFV